MSEKESPVVSGFESIDLRNKKGVLIDLDNTLYPYDINHKRALASCRSLAKAKYEIAVDLFDEGYRRGRKTVHVQLEHRASSHSRLLYFQKASEFLFKETQIDFALEMEQLYWETFLSGMEWFPAAKEFLSECRSRGLKTCIITDLTTHIQMRKWKKLGLDQYIDFLVSSEEAGIEKPNRLIFEMALEKLSLKSEDVIMVGDNQKKDILGAEDIGIRAYLIQPLA